MGWEQIKAGFDTPRELFAWILAGVATGLLHSGAIDQWGWLAAVATASTLLGWLRRVEVGQLKVGSDE